MTELRWSDLNQQWLVAVLARLRERIIALRAGTASASPRADSIADTPTGFTPALVRCSEVFGLSPFERELLLLVAGVELDRDLRSLITELNGSPAPSFSLGLKILTQPHWDAIGSDSPLRYWRLIEASEGMSLLDAPLAIDERVLHFITGVRAFDSRLAGAVRVVPAFADPYLDGDQIVQRIVDALQRGGDAVGPVILLEADAAQLQTLRGYTLAAIRQHAQSALWISSHALPGDPHELSELARRVDRETALTGYPPILVVTTDSRDMVVTDFVDQLRSVMIVLGSTGSWLASLSSPRSIVRLQVAPSDSSRLRATLVDRCKAGSGHESNGNDIAAAVDRALTQFVVTPQALDGMVAAATEAAPHAVGAAVWNAARTAARGGLDTLAHRIVTHATFDDLVLPAAQMTMLRDITRHLRHRERVYHEWGFAEKNSRGQGMTALFSGESGTGKTLAAEAIANEAELDLYRVDLAVVVSKYIGETEKNLKRVFDAAEASGAVLLFDEADALFGKRSEVKDSHDRYANIEIAYLLQRVEAYRGLAILTTNMKTALDRAFLRRIRFVIHFPFPDNAARERIWRMQFPRLAPLGDIDYTGLARLNLAGGHINSIAITAAFQAADSSGRIDNAALTSAARAEFAKLERSFNSPALGESV